MADSNEVFAEVSRLAAEGNSDAVMVLSGYYWLRRGTSMTSRLEAEAHLAAFLARIGAQA